MVICSATAFVARHRNHLPRRQCFVKWHGEWGAVADQLARGVDAVGCMYDKSSPL